MATRDFLVSYAIEDEAWAQWIAWQLKLAGYSTALRKWDFRPGSSFVIEMQRTMADAQASIVILSPAYLRSQETQSEWSASFVDLVPEGKTLPIRVAPIETLGPLASILSLDLTGLNENQAREALLDAVRTLRNEAAPKAMPPSLSGPSTIEAPPFPKTLPRVWNLPNAPEVIVGRSILIEKLHQLLTSAQSEAARVVLVAMGGAGKTQLAIQYANFQRSNYEVVWLLRADTVQHLSDDFLALGRSIGLNLEEYDQSARISAVRTWCEKHDDWLLIFDNAIDPKDVEPFLPHGSNGHVVLTSRNTTWPPPFKVLDVSVLTSAEAVEFLSEHLNSTDIPAMERLSHTVGNLPLGLELAASFIKNRGISIDEFVKTAKDQEEGSPKDSIAILVRQSLPRVEADSWLAPRLLYICAFWNSDDIPYALFQSEASLVRSAAYNRRRSAAHSADEAEWALTAKRRGKPLSRFEERRVIVCQLTISLLR